MIPIMQTPHWQPFAASIPAKQLAHVSCVVASSSKEMHVDCTQAPSMLVHTPHSEAFGKKVLLKLAALPSLFWPGERSAACTFKSCLTGSPVVGPWCPQLPWQATPHLL